MAVPKKYEHINFTPPEGVAKAAEKGLEFRAKASPSNRGGLTPSQASAEGIGSGVQRAVNLKNRNTVSPKVVKQMKAFFARHEKNKGVKEENKGTPWNDKGYVAWLLWGGDPGKTWAEKIVGQMEKADEKEKNSKKASENVPNNPKLWAKVIKLTKGELKSLSGNGKTFKTPNADNPDKPDGFTKYPSAYANGWASNVYKELGGTWSKKKKEKKSKEYKMPRKWDKDHCESKTCDEMGFSEKASCAPYKKCPKKASVGTHKLPPLPYSYTALEPIISRDTLHFHHTKHHQSYVDGLNKAEIGLARARQQRDERLVSAFTEDIAFNWGGHFLHTIYWHCLSADRKGVPFFLMGLIIREFGSFDNFYFNFVEVAKSVKGSGWAVLVLRNGQMKTPKLEIVGVKNHEHQVLWASHVLLPIDVWEHAYYLDHQNDRESHFEKVFHDLVNWNYVESRLKRSLQSRLVSQTLRKLAKGKAKKDVGHGGLDTWFSGHGQGKSKNKGKATWGDWIAISPVKRTITKEDGSKKTYEPGDIIGPCGTVSNDDDWKDLTNNGKSPFKCMARPKAHKIPKKERAELAKNKQKAEKGKNTQKPTLTPTFKKEKKAMVQKRVFYSPKPFGRLKPVRQEKTPSFGKPKGLWYSCGNSWKDFVENEMGGMGGYSYMYEIEINPSKMLIINDHKSFLAFNDEFSLPDPRGYDDVIDWYRVSQKYDGIEICPYMRKFRMSHFWYYSWDVASGCIWGSGAIKKVKEIPLSTKLASRVASRSVSMESLTQRVARKHLQAKHGGYFIDRSTTPSTFYITDGDKVLQYFFNGRYKRKFTYAKGELPIGVSSLPIGEEFDGIHYDGPAVSEFASIVRNNNVVLPSLSEVRKITFSNPFDPFKEWDMAIGFPMSHGEPTGIPKFDKKGATRNNFQIHHRSYTSAMQEAYDYAEANGYLVDEDDVFQQVTTGRGKPRVGETRNHSLGLWGLQNGRKQRKALQVQVYGMESGTYELNAYIL